MRKNEVDFQKLDINKKRVDLEHLMRMCAQLECKLKEKNDPLYKIALKAHKLAKDIYDDESIEKKVGIEVPVLAKGYGVKPGQLRKILRSFGIFDKNNRPTDKFSRWFIRENYIYYSIKGCRCVAQKTYIKKSKLVYLERFLKKEAGDLLRWLRL